MAYILAVRTDVLGGMHYEGDVLPSVAGDGITFQAGDWYHVLGATNPGLYRCTTGGVGGVAVWAGPV